VKITLIYHNEKKKKQFEWKILGQNYPSSMVKKSCGGYSLKRRRRKRLIGLSSANLPKKIK
jgi:hypothetical protein